MAVHITEITASNLGPLATFELKPGPVNLIYGKNERGKTYLVEFIIHLLFRKSKEWRLRQTRAGGRVVLTGLNEKPVHFIPGKKERLEDYWETARPGLPPDFSRLLVVKGAEMELSPGSGGADKQVVKEYLSQQGLFRTIEENIEATIKKVAVAASGRIEGPNQGKNGTRMELEEQLKEIDDCLENISASDSGSSLLILRRRKEEIQKQLELQEQARRYRAFRLSLELQDIAAKRDEIDGGQLEKVSQNILILGQKRQETARKKEEEQKARKAAQHHEWLESAQEIYQTFLEKSADRYPIIVPLLGAAALVAGGILAYFSFTIPALICLGLALGAGFFFWRRTAMQLRVQNRNQERERIERDFQKRFGKELDNLAQIKEMLREKETHLNRAQLLSEQIAAIAGEERNLALAIQKDLFRFSGSDISPEKWRATVRSLEDTRKKLDEAYAKKRGELEAMGVNPPDFYRDDPGLAYNPKEEQRLRAELDNTGNDIYNQEKDLELLKQRIYGLTRDSSGRGWEERLTALFEKRRETSEELQHITAEIVGKKLVWETLSDLQKEEDEKISEILESDDIRKPLLAMTGRYQSLRLEGEQIRLFDGTQEYDLADLSTGAQEQVLMALRLSFAARLAERQPMFLLLDDAFQYSDWERRKRLVGQVLGLADLGWQIFYFTMDDHLRDLVKDFCRKEGKKLTYKELT